MFTAGQPQPVKKGLSTAQMAARLRNLAAGREQRETVEFHERLERERVRRDAEDAREAKRVSYVRCRIKISRQFLH